MNLYVASSWRNKLYPDVIMALRDAGHYVWDWRKPPNGAGGFGWIEVDPAYVGGGPVPTARYREMLEHPRAEQGFRNDFDGMMQADACVLLLPCGRSAHTEAGYMGGRGKPVYVIRQDDQEPDLMYKLFDGIFGTVEEVIKHIGV